MPTRKAPEGETTHGGAGETLADVSGQPWGVNVSARVTQSNPIDDADADDADAVVSRFNAALASPSADRMRIRVYKSNNENGKLDFCREMLPTQFQAPDMFERLRKEWGAGEFEFRLIGDAGIVRRIRQSIAAPLAPLDQPAALAPQSDAIAQALMMLAQNQNAILQALTQRPDPRAEMMQNLEQLRLMREIFAPAHAPVAPAAPVDQLAMVDKVFAMVANAKRAVRELNDDEPPTDPLGASLPKLIDAASALVLQNNRPPAAVAPIVEPASLTHNRATAAQHPQHDQTHAALPVAEPLPINMEDPSMLLIRGAVEDLIDMAKRGDSPEKGGEYIADKVPDELLEYMDNRYWFEFVVNLFPALRDHEAWVRAAKAHADTLFTDEPESPTP